VLALLFQLDTLSIQTQASSLGLIITFVTNFHFNLVVMFVFLVNQSPVVNLIYLDKLILLYKKYLVNRDLANRHLINICFGSQAIWVTDIGLTVT